MSNQRGGAMSHRFTGDDGSVTLESVLIYPAILLVLGIILQGGLWMHAQNLAQSAASAGANSAKAYNADPSTGMAAANTNLANNGNSLNNAQVSINRTADTATATVTGTAPSFVPFLNPRVEATVTTPVERWTEP